MSAQQHVDQFKDWVKVFRNGFILGKLSVDAASVSLWELGQINMDYIDEVRGNPH